MNQPHKTYWPNGLLLKEEWGENGILHALDRPAYRSWYNNSQLQREEWRREGQLHRVNGPARIEWSPYGRLEWKEWAVNGQYHRIGAPAILNWDADGRLRLELWYVNGRYYRLDGPVRSNWINGELQSEVWVWNSQEYTRYNHPYNQFRLEHQLVSQYEDWPDDMKILFKLTYGGEVVQCSAPEC